MKISTELILALYGAALSTGLAALTALKFFRERPRISVEASRVHKTAAADQATHGVLVRVKRGEDFLWEEADVEIRVRNAGGQACQISDVFVETATAIHRVRPNGLPAILDPNTSFSVLVQPEYFAPKTCSKEGVLMHIPVEAVGVFDGLGKKYQISTENLTTLLCGYGGLPVRTAVYKHKQTGNFVVAFPVADAATIDSKK
jgi:hypothetical protein